MFPLTQKNHVVLGRESILAHGFICTGKYDEPILDVRSITMSVHPEAEWTPGPNPPPSIGAIIQFRPRLQAVVNIPTAEFDRAWSLAISGHLKFCYFACTEPRKRYSAILSVALTNRSEDEEEESNEVAKSGVKVGSET